ncbi:Protein GrpE [Jeotgalicoccus saudimassiliensis]|uniref:Protein GrpE n=1 Tax=Jeotgalicoccus saudimassiliensis TaxID=1461582 RepID=A0A078M169_9STAP|nr:nucleotide exchange factor GrpE [Jeotgalicoccus saudimassiliensis]CDZ99950.1 Protein GrpE [Jeotgalicoccus saudimassiliensis]
MTNEEEKDTAVNETSETAPEETKEQADTEAAAETEKTETEEAPAEETAKETEEVTEEDEISALKEQIEESENKYLKLYAEFENFKRRNRQEAEINNKYKDQKFAENLLPVLDNLERALAIDGTDESFIALNKGVEMVYNNLVETLEKHDIKAIDALDQPFDPNFHQAVMTEASDKDSDIVIEEFQKGYILKDRVIRPTMVKVSE